MEKLFHGCIIIISLVIVNIYIPICKTCDNFYLETQDFKQRIAKDKSDVKNPITALARSYWRQQPSRAIFSNIFIIL